METRHTRIRSVCLSTGEMERQISVLSGGATEADLSQSVQQRKCHAPMRPYRSSRGTTLYRKMVLSGTISISRYLRKFRGMIRGASAEHAIVRRPISGCIPQNIGTKESVSIIFCLLPCRKRIWAYFLAGHDYGDDTDVDKSCITAQRCREAG
jgi:hypothetical protein